MPSRLPDSGPRERVTGGKHACMPKHRRTRLHPRGWNLAHAVGSGRYHAAQLLIPARDQTRHQNPHEEAASSDIRRVKEDHCRPPTMNIPVCWFCRSVLSVRLAKHEGDDDTRPFSLPA
ncbi:hypothetical protein CSHISOI_09508 [Colletotrichum shisoi]|uniref:Uncharacterized protein n=1 Tax=Colletotrichum shisoi TaxID=2078593 RepID=A0A5Q4BG64_9PEZI|nr:hypothetical protein CSHISOI_09508 [Colletotrichum shisoi]